MDHKRAWNYALWLLGRKAYSEAQLRDKLQRKEVAADTIDRILARLTELNFIDDEAFATAYVRTRRQGKGPLALGRELRHKGIDEQTTSAALESLDDASQLATAVALLERNAWRFSKAKDAQGGEAERERKRRDRAFAFLARRGFGSEVVVEALERVFGEG